MRIGPAQRLEFAFGIVEHSLLRVENAHRQMRTAQGGLRLLQSRNALFFQHFKPCSAHLLRDACDLFAGCFEAMQSAGYKLLDPWSNIGHSLKQGSAYDEKFIDATNEREMWGAWAVEPFLGTNELGVKLEDVVWFGEDGCEVLR